jgi:hypothetical protein
MACFRHSGLCEPGVWLLLPSWQHGISSMYRMSRASLTREILGGRDLRGFDSRTEWITVCAAMTQLSCELWLGARSVLEAPARPALLYRFGFGLRPLPLR